eukprot:CAMPEP_0116994132 /NCGR_PEP_ID=MMETSP0467-20121206/67919_1 /TAXON_ID=283647 /ORGANISM="Mesodinium pulex, Strain SPMC105" /LENGTH=30 /DNA_ID= /DNA_START= /DNA_END= /DNA_ORIENTATION=
MSSGRQARGHAPSLYGGRLARAERRRRGAH